MWKTYEEMTAKERYYLHLGLYPIGKYDKKISKSYWLV